MIMITPIYAALLGLMLIGLSVYVIKGRRTYGAGLGDAEHMELRRRIRAQANLAEYTPLFLILLGCAEYNGLPFWAIHLFGIVFLAGRIMHAYSLLKAEHYDHHTLTNNPTWRIGGMICTFNTIGLLALIVLAQSLMSGRFI